jgi:DNA-binding CsgD family transcriptional regulator
MSLWQRLRRALRVSRLDPSLLTELDHLAERERRSYEAVAADLLTAALHQRQSAEANLQRWQMLSPREQQVAALICLDYTNAQIASRLSISLPTVKSHVRNILLKFRVSHRGDLRHVLADWDFSDWDRKPQ